MRLIVALVVFGSVCAQEARADCHMAPAAVLPLLGDRRPIVQAAINGTPVTMIIDTGADGSSVTPETVQNLHLIRDAAKRTMIRTVGGEEMRWQALVPALTVGNVSFFDQSLPVVPLDGVKSTDGPAGLIGTNLIGVYDLEFDFPGKTLSLFRPGSCTPWSPPWQGHYQTIRALPAQRRKLLFPVMLNGKTVTALFDTGSVGETVAASAAERIGVGRSDLDRDPTAQGVSAGQHAYAVRRHRFDTLTVGEETFHDVPLDVADFHQDGIDMLVGVDFMMARRLFVSFSGSMLYIQRHRTDTGEQPRPSSMDHCRPPADVQARLAPDKPVSYMRVSLPAPEKIRTDHIDGCAGVSFRLDPDGTPRDVTVVTEYPTGYGLGDHAKREVEAARFRGPSGASAALYYEAHRFHVD